MIVFPGPATIIILERHNKKFKVFKNVPVNCFVSVRDDLYPFLEIQ